MIVFDIFQNPVEIYFMFALDTCLARVLPAKHHSASRGE